MEYSQDGLRLTEGFEGLRLTAYQDPTGVWTIGFGHTAAVRQGDTCTYDDAVEYLREDIHEVVYQINRDVKVPLTQGEFDALVDFGFNLGMHNLETSTLWKKLNVGDFSGAAAEFPRWSKAGGREIAGLLKRRIAEQSAFLQGT